MFALGRWCAWAGSPAPLVASAVRSALADLDRSVPRPSEEQIDADCGSSWPSAPRGRPVSSSLAEVPVIIVAPAVTATVLLRDQLRQHRPSITNWPGSATARVSRCRAPARSRTGAGLRLVPAVAAGGLVKAVTFEPPSSGVTICSRRDGPGAAQRAWRSCGASVGRIGEEALLQRADEDLAALAAAELSVLLATGVRGAPVAHRVTRWGGGAASVRRSGTWTG